jgi:transposase
MPWEEKTKVSIRSEFVFYANREGANIAELSRRYGVSRPTAYKWIERSGEGSTDALQDQSRRPHTSPHQTPGPMVTKILELRAKHPKWGGRKLRKRLLVLGVHGVPAASTITEVLRRNGLLFSADSAKATARQAIAARG